MSMISSKVTILNKSPHVSLKQWIVENKIILCVSTSIMRIKEKTLGKKIGHIDRKNCAYQNLKRLRKMNMPHVFIKATQKKIQLAGIIRKKQLYIFIQAYTIHSRKVVLKLKVFHSVANLMNLRNMHSFTAKKISISLHIFLP